MRRYCKYLRTISMGVKELAIVKFSETLELDVLLACNFTRLSSLTKPTVCLFIPNTTVQLVETIASLGSFAF